jgi:hypothetical protein
MRRALRIQTVFVAVRLAAEHLRDAYGGVVPVVSREVLQKPRAEAVPHEALGRRRRRGSSG